MTVTQDCGESDVQTARPACLRLGRKIRGAPVVETCVGDTDADRLPVRAMRSPWRVWQRSFREEISETRT